MRLYPLVYEVDGASDEKTVKLELFSSYRDMKQRFHSFVNRALLNPKMLEPIDIPINKRGLLAVNKLTLFAAAHTDVDWFIENVPGELERLLKEGKDES